MHTKRLNFDPEYIPKRDPTTSESRHELSVPAAGLSLSSCSPAQLVSGGSSAQARPSQMRSASVFALLRTFAHSPLQPAPSRRHRAEVRRLRGRVWSWWGRPIGSRSFGGRKYTHDQPHPRLFCMHSMHCIPLVKFTS